MALSDEEVEVLRWRIIDEEHAREAARDLIAQAKWLISQGEPLPAKLRWMIVDGLGDLESRDPLALFRSMKAPKGKARGRPAVESENERLLAFRDIHRLQHEGYPLAGPGEKYPFKTLEGTAFMEYARRCAEVGAPDARIRKDARRLQSAFWKRARELQPAQQVDLGLLEYLPRKK